MLPSLDGQLHTEKLTYQLILSEYTDDQTMLQSDWMRSKPTHTQQKEVVSDATLT